MGADMKITIACAAVAASAAAALVTAPAALADPEGDFLTTITKGGITWPADKTKLVIATGYGVCHDWEGGASFGQEVADLTSVTRWTDAQARFFVGAATVAFCPEYESIVSGSTGPLKS
jgi:hypothetical protein